MNEPNDDAELRRLYVNLQAATAKAIETAEAAPKPLRGEALRRYLDADAKVMDIVCRIKEIRTTRKPWRDR